MPPNDGPNVPLAAPCNRILDVLFLGPISSSFEARDGAVCLVEFCCPAILETEQGMQPTLCSLPNMGAQFRLSSDGLQDGWREVRQSSFAPPPPT